MFFKMFQTLAEPVFLGASRLLVVLHLPDWGLSTTPVLAVAAALLVGVFLRHGGPAGNCPQVAAEGLEPSGSALS